MSLIDDIQAFIRQPRIPQPAYPEGSYRCASCFSTFHTSTDPFGDPCFESSFEQVGRCYINDPCPICGDPFHAQPLRKKVEQTAKAHSNRLICPGCNNIGNLEAEMLPNCAYWQCPTCGMFVPIG